MPFSVRQITQDDKLCHQVNLEVLQEVYPRETVEQVLSDCHAWEKREKALSMVAIVYLVIALTLFPRLTIGGVLRRLASGARFLWPDPNEAVATEGAICQRRQQLGVTVLRQLFRRCCHPLATPSTKGAFYRGRRVWPSMARARMWPMISTTPTTLAASTLAPRRVPFRNCAPCTCWSAPPMPFLMR